MTALVSQRASDAFLDLALAGDRPQAVRLTLDLVDEGFSLPAVLHAVVGAAQYEVGLRWQRAELSVADEHLVTGISQAALTALSANGHHQQVAAGTVVVACAEGDWHALPSQMFAESLRAAGQGVLHLGASVPAADVGALLERRRPDALVVTCNLPLSYLGVASLADAAHRWGVPVLAGGRALNAARACTLGADAWAADVASALEILGGWRSDPPAVGADPVDVEPVAVTLDQRSRAIADRALAVLAERSPAIAGDDGRQRDRTRDDLVSIVRFLAAARLVDDDEVFTDFSAWLEEVLTVRGVPAAAVAAGLAALAPLIREIDEHGAALVEAAAARLD
ncbi:MAG: cobalamin-dependent protein [Nitriliruptoraceae bacterium]